MPDRLDHIRQRLTDALAPTVLRVVDESHLHAGHVGAREGKGHFALTIAAAGLEGKGLLEQHRMIYEALGDLMQTDIHALRIRIVKGG